jgi:hypothetical protein
MAEEGKREAQPDVCDKCDSKGHTTTSCPYFKGDPEPPASKGIRLDSDSGIYYFLCPHCNEMCQVITKCELYNWLI